jgi:ribonuclease BN (tRNA processing enzyme)
MEAPMKLTVLGSGTMLPTKKRFPSSFLLEVGGKKILLDCGHGAIARLTQIGIDLRDIDLVFISHFHTDHFGDAFNLVHSRFVGDLYEEKLHKELTFLGPKTIEARFRNWRMIFWPEPNEEYPLKFLEGTREFFLDDIRITLFPVIHVRWFRSVGIIIEYQGKKLVYPGDVGSQQDFDELIEMARDAHLLVIEAGFEHMTPNHFSVAQIRKLVHEAHVKKALIVHLRPMPEEEARIERLISSENRYLMANDMMWIEI